jgi:hypothetical protein
LSYGIRTTPDVSFNADPNTGVAVYDSVSYSGKSGWFEVGGTSAAAPSWAGLIAITDQGLAAAGKSTLSSIQTLTQLYRLPSSDFHDISTGANGYSATTGYDLVTGLGSPKANLLVASLLSANGVASGPVAATSTVVSTATSQSHTTATPHGTGLSSTPNGSSSGSAITSFLSATSVTGSLQLAALPATSTLIAQSGGFNSQTQTASSIATSAAFGSSITSASSLGQGTQSQAAPVVAHTREDATLTSIIDSVQPSESPAGATDPAAEPAGSPTANPAPQPVLPPELFDLGLDPIIPFLNSAKDQRRDGESYARTEEVPAGQADDGTGSGAQSRSGSAVSVLIGTAVIVAGGHNVASCRAGWRRRWLSRRIGPA